jgi:hypothetical protein
MFQRVEYSMLQAAFERGWLNRERAILESLLSIRRAGAASSSLISRNKPPDRWFARARMRGFTRSAFSAE